MMKKVTVFISALLISILGISQKSEVILNPDVFPVIFHGVTQALIDYREDPNAVNEITKTAKPGYHPKSDWILNPRVNQNALPLGEDPILQKQYAPTSSQRALTQNFQGMGNSGVDPADPSVDVGPNHVVQMINGGSGSYIQVFSKTGSSMMAPVYFDNFMSMPGGAGDPIVLYDERADRWLLSEFSTSGNNMHVAISQTPDPTGSYYTYTFNAPGFPDYPKYSIWQDSYVITTNESTSAVYALDRTKLLVGTNATAQRFSIPTFGTIGFQAATPVSLNGTTLPPSGTPAMVMRMRDDAWAGAATDALEIWEFDIDWVTPSNTSLTQTSTLAISPFDSELCGFTSFQCIPQPGGGQLDPLREILMNRIHYRNFTSHESIVCCHVADVDGSDHAGVRWYELRRTGGTGGSWTIYQEGTYAPDAEHRWMASIGISASGNIGLAYNVSSSSVYPSLRYTGRKECDPIGVMTEPETVIIAGGGSNGSNRYGDYNAMGLDPTDGETFWFTGMYNPSSSWSTRIAAFSMPSCSPGVQFSSSTYDVDETDANVDNGCRDYYVLNVPVQIGSDPSQPADITVNVTGGTATNGVDYDISNTTFTLDGSTLIGNAEIWIYNDDYVEGAETITLDYSLNANGGDATAGLINQTVTITINDDDLAPASMVSTTTILSEDFESGFGGFTTTNPSGDTPWQIGDVTAAATTAYAIPATNATQFAWINDDMCDCNQNDVDLIFPVIDLTNFTSATLSLDSYYENNNWQGNQETAEIRVSVNGGAYALIAAVVASQIDVDWTNQIVDLTPYVGNASVQLAVNYSDGTGWLYGCTIDNVLITGSTTIGVQTAVNTNAGDTAYLGPNGTVHFYDAATSDVMMTLVNTSSFDYGCVRVEVDRDGSTPTALQFASTAIQDYLHSKTFTVIPENANPTGTFDVTLYYEEAEVAAWETFTGNSRSNVEIIKVSGNNRINDVTPANYTSHTIDNINATVGAFNSDVTLTASFINGFSGFGAGIYNLTTSPVTHTVVNTNPSCAGGTDGSIVITASGGSSPYEYSIDNGVTYQPSNTFTGLSAGTYNVIIRDAGLVSSVMSVEVLSDPPAITYSEVSADPGCNGGSDGTITLTGSGGSGSLQYSIDGGTTFQASGSFSGLSSGVYNVVVEDASLCTTSGTITLSDPAGVNYSVTTSDPLCNGGSDGSMTISGSGGNGSFTYSIDNGVSFQSSGNFTGLLSGTYDVVVEDGNGCQDNGTVTINDPPALSYTSSFTSPTCYNGTNGNISLAASGGTPSYQYSIDNGITFQSSGTFLNLPARVYDIIIQDANGCQSVGNVTLLDPAEIVFSSSSFQASCGANDGSLSIIATGGTGTLQYSINNGVTFQASGVFGSLPSGVYNYIIMDSNNCTETGSETISNSAGIVVNTLNSTDPLCNGDSNGTITVSASGGAGTLNYSIDSGSTFQSSGNYTGLSSGTYYVVVEDSTGCQVVSSIVLNNPAVISLNSSTTDESCGLVNGSITLTASGGTTPFQYSINNGTSFQSSGSFTGLSPGNYTVVSQDANSCFSVSSTVTVSSSSGITLDSVTSTDPVCNGDANGSIVISATTSNGQVFYSINGGTSNQSTGTFTGLNGGTYNVVVTDSIGCQDTSTVIINEPLSVSYTVTTSNETCGTGDGEITISGSGGSGSLQYSINGGTSFQSTGTFTSLSAGVFNIVVEDALGCQATGNQTITSSTGITLNSITSDNPSCVGGSDGSIVIVATGGSGGIQYSIDNGVSFQFSGTFTNLLAGTYNMLIEDTSGCQVFSSISLNDPPTITITANTTSENCGSNDGAINLTATGGSGSFQYSIDNGAFFQSSPNFTNLNAGSYSVVVEDSDGCTNSQNVILNSAGGVSISNITTSNPLCNGDGNGSIVILSSGGNGVQYSIDNGSSYQSASTFSGLSAGNYNVIALDDNGCLDSDTISINEPGPIVYSPVIVSENCGDSDASITLSGSGGTGSLQYSIDGGSTFQASDAFSNLTSGLYNVVIQDGVGCSISSTETIGSIGGPSINVINSSNPGCNGDSDGSVSVLASGTTSLQYSINGGTTYQSSGNFSGLSAGIYTVVVRDSAGCMSFGSITVVDPPSLTSVTSVIEASCGNNDGSASAFGTGGTGTLNYQWDDPQLQTTGVATGLYAGLYSVTITDANGCETFNSAIISNVGDPGVIMSSSDISCSGNGDGTVTATPFGGQSPYSYVWDDAQAQTTATATGLTSGFYLVQISDNLGCIEFGTALVTEPTPLVATSQSSNTTCALGNGFVSVNTSGGTAPFTFNWDDSNSQSNPVAVNLWAGIYTVTITDDNGCSTTTSGTVGDSDSLSVDVDVSHERCPGFEDGSIITAVTGGTSPYNYIWSNQDTTSQISAVSAGVYTLVITDQNGCSASLNISVETEGEMCITIPTAISPNNDGSNDVWIIDGIDIYPNATVEIFNRWGSILYTANGYQNNWDGTFNGNDVPAGVYYYVVKISDDEVYTGSITVLR